MTQMSDSSALAYSGAIIAGNSGRSRLLILAVASLAIIALVVVLYLRGLSGSSRAAERAKATAPCYLDTDCPDGTFCSHSNQLCVPISALPPLAPPLLPQPSEAARLGVGERIGRAVDRVLGRGRGGEGSEVQNVSLEKKGQNP
jgi:hypothetical protein